DRARLAQARAREQAAVAELVDQDQVGVADERRDRADVREITAAEHDRVLAALERRELALELGVERVIAVHESRGASADALAGLRVVRASSSPGSFRCPHTTTSRFAAARTVPSRRTRP